MELHDFNTAVLLNQGVNTTIRNLLLAIPAQGKLSGKLFLQVKCQNKNDWLLYYIYSADVAKVSICLKSLEASKKN
jgi:hypothetical protein